MEYNFHQHVTKDDYVAFVMNHLKMSFYKPFNMALFIVSVGYLLISPILDPGNFTFLFIGLGIVLLLVAMMFYARKNAAKTYDNSAAQFDMSYRVNDEGLTYILDEGQLEKKWGEFYSVKETEEYLYVYVNKNSGMVIVKREVPNDALSFVKQKLTLHVLPKRVKLLKETD